MDQITKLNSEYLEIIPKKNPEMMTYLLNKWQVNTEIDILKSLYEFSFKFRSILGASINSKKINPYDYIMGSLGIKLEALDPNSEETNLILHNLNSQQNQHLNLTNIFKIGGLDYSKKEDDRFLNIGNHKMLWHGTPSDNILSILKKGLRIRSSNANNFHGNRFGIGIYFSDSFDLSNCFSTQSGTEKYVLLCEVATGNTANI